MGHSGGGGRKQENILVGENQKGHGRKVNACTHYLRQRTDLGQGGGKGEKGMLEIFRWTRFGGKKSSV